MSITWSWCISNLRYRFFFPRPQVWSLLVSTRPPTTASWSATSISVRICTPTPFCPEAPACTQVSPTGCRRRSPPLPQAAWRSRSSLLPRGNTPYGSVAPSWPPSPPSNRCGSASRSTTSPVHPSSTASASKCLALATFHTETDFRDSIGAQAKLMFHLISPAILLKYLSLSRLGTTMQFSTKSARPRHSHLVITTHARTSW